MSYIIVLYYFINQNSRECRLNYLLFFYKININLNSFLIDVL